MLICTITRKGGSYEIRNGTTSAGKEAEGRQRHREGQMLNRGGSDAPPLHRIKGRTCQKPHPKYPGG
jgi:hypothetical protein